MWISFPYKIDSICVWNLGYGLDMHPIYRNYPTSNQQD